MPDAMLVMGSLFSRSAPPSVSNYPSDVRAQINRMEILQRSFNRRAVFGHLIDFHLRVIRRRYQGDTQSNLLPLMGVKRRLSSATVLEEVKLDGALPYICAEACDRIGYSMKSSSCAHFLIMLTILFLLQKGASQLLHQESPSPPQKQKGTI